MPKVSLATAANGGMKYSRMNPEPLPLFKVRMSPLAGGSVANVLNSGYIGQGEQVELFEHELGGYLGHPSPLTVNSATSGLNLAIRLACGIGDNRDEILTQPITCTATTWSILASGFRPRWVDTSAADGNMDLADLQRKISSKTRAIMLVHWGGYPNDLDAIRRIQHDCYERFGHRPPVIEDAAHAFGAEYQGKKLGRHGNFTVFSFQAIKHLTTGDGGAVLCPDAATAQRGRLLRWYGLDRTKSQSFRCDQDVVDWGYKFHMNDINAAIGRVNLHSVDETLAAHRSNAAFFRQKLAGIPGITLLSDAPDRVSSCWIFTIRAANRDGLQSKLNQHNIMCGRVHARNDAYKCTRAYVDHELPGTDLMEREMLCLPVGWWLSESDRQTIVDVVQSGW